MLNRDRDPVRQRLSRLAWLLDNSIALPGTKFRIGLDALIGLVPGLGDLIGVLLSSYIVAEAARIGAPRAVLIRMAANVAIEGLFGLVPFLGDIFDAAWKANQRNVRLLNNYWDEPRQARRASNAFVLILALLLLGIFTSVCILAYYTVRWLVTIGSGGAATI